MNNIPEQIKLAGDGVAIIGWLSALTGAITSLFALFAAILSFAWGAIRIYETKTFQTWLGKRRARSNR